MRRNHSLQGSNAPCAVGKLSITGMPVEWLDAGSWRLPSGKALAEFALQAGFLAPLLFKAERYGSASSDRQQETLNRGLLAGKHANKGTGQ
jgi:hypothetical protein